MQIHLEKISILAGERAIKKFNFRKHALAEVELYIGEISLAEVERVSRFLFRLELTK